VACHAHTLALDVKGQVYSWGFGGAAALGNGHFQDCWVPQLVDQLPPCRAIAGSHVSFACSQDGRAFCWGSSPALANPDPAERASARPARCLALQQVQTVALSCGPKHAVAVAKDGAALIWGAPGSVPTALRNSSMAEAESDSLSTSSSRLGSAVERHACKDQRHAARLASRIISLAPANSSTWALVRREAYAPDRARAQKACATLLTAWSHAWCSMVLECEVAKVDYAALPADGFIFLAFVLGLINNRVGIAQVLTAVCLAIRMTSKSRAPSGVPESA
jgi:alpha-tubulin suppressor-like RCC1 family protein